MRNVEISCAAFQFATHGTGSLLECRGTATLGADLLPAGNRPHQGVAKGGCAVRIAVSGTHITGKSSLVAALGERLPHHTIVPEPYEVLAERGYEFAHPPGVDDFVVQLKQSLITLRRRSPNLIFDRCPLDFLGYISASSGASRFDLDAWRGPIARAIKSLDLVVALHVNSAHDPAIPVEDAALRLAVDDVLRDIVDSDGFDLCDGVEILILDGSWDRRVETVLTHVERLHAQGLASPRY